VTTQRAPIRIYHLYQLMILDGVYAIARPRRALCVWFKPRTWYAPVQGLNQIPFLTLDTAHVTCLTCRDVSRDPTSLSHMCFYEDLLKKHGPLEIVAPALEPAHGEQAFIQKSQTEETQLSLWKDSKKT